MALLDCVALCFPCVFNSTPVLKINQTAFKILNLLGEGGFSYVYLVQSNNNRNLYALKKIRCPFGNSNFKAAMKEVDNYKEFRSPFIIKSIDSSVVQEPDGSKTLYILLPYFDTGSLQDIINQNSVNNSRMDESEALRLFIGVCRGVQSMHRHQVSKNYSMVSVMEPNSTVDDDENNPFLSNMDESSRDDTELQETTSFAHRDIKPANIMLAKDGTPVLCDLGSCEKARVSIKSRAQAITVQELSNEHCTLPYRAPELLDIKVGDEIDEKIDIWSLGCTLYALLYGYSPFEREELVNGANITLAISSGNYSFPSSPDYSEALKDLIKYCLVLDPHERPSIEDVLTKALQTQRDI
ncbi:hypothetical protein OGAPHI_006480 [Ogataea philodendri]|uniref:non-specific serine/threonine protein kinase n=1 Tax=Ogataea philodendri TaxID=1378263 RepID=A0A9P8NY32_9ASCO|nr:uncharacterized protein OGAPHI_006480 [Ogataea philodendri]KAH3661630.1 hypothetical protein OGAPHI_006480 [Ogataea philodendri]